MAENIKFFNAFLLRKNINAESNTGANYIRAIYKPVFPGLPWNPNGYPLFPTSHSTDATGRTKDSGTLIQQGGRNWMIEEARIRGGYNNLETGYGVRAYLRESSNLQSRRESALIYSGIYNSRTDVNEINVFSVAEGISTAVDPAHGSIQKLHALDTNLAILQENKVSRALINKNVIYSGDQGAKETTNVPVIGQIVPYVGDYGISKNPESFAVFGYRRYFSDRYRNAIMRLSKDGMTEISQNGMSDFFRDELGKLTDDFKIISFNVDFNSFSSTSPFRVNISGTYMDDVEKGSQIFIPQTSGSPIIGNVIGVAVYATSRELYISVNPTSTADITQQIEIKKYTKDRITAGWDVHNKNYLISLQDKSTDIATADLYKTLSFEEEVLGWTSFYTYEPKFASSLKNSYYSFYGADVYLHHNNTYRNRFYGIDNNSYIKFIFNDKVGLSKNFQTFGYEGSNGWEVTSFESGEQGPYGASNTLFVDTTNPIKSYEEGAYRDEGIQYRAGFYRKQDKYAANLVNANPISPGEVIFNSSGGGRTTGIKGFFGTAQIQTDTTTEAGGMKELFSVSTEYALTSQ